MNKATDTVRTLLVMTVGFGLAALSATSADAAGDRYAAVTTRSSIASVFDRIDPDPDVIGGVTSADVTTTAAGDVTPSVESIPAAGALLARNSSANRHAFRNWRHRVNTGSSERAGAVASPRSKAPERARVVTPTVASGKPEYRARVSSPASPASSAAEVGIVRPSGRGSRRARFWTPNSKTHSASSSATKPRAAQPVREAQASLPTAAATPKPSPKAPAGLVQPAKPLAKQPHPTAKLAHTIAKPAATEPVKLAAAAPAAVPSAVRVSTTNSGTVELASSAQAEVAPSRSVPSQPVRNNPEVREAMVTRGSTTQGRVNIMRVLTGKSLIIDLTSDAKRVSVADPDVAEVLIITSRQVMVNGLSDGETTIIIWDKRGHYSMYSLVVGDTLADQVMLEVTVAEINRTAMEKHGVDTRQFGGQFGSITQFGGVAPVSGQHPPDVGDPLFPVSLDGGISWAVVDLKNDIQVLFKQMQDENLGRILAEPKLLARSGKEASFLSGGEIPIVVTTNDDTSIEFKEFGTKIEFTPTVREDGTIDLILKSEVSEPDFTAGVELFGFKVPAFITRKTETEVTLANGESLIVAGLMKEVKQELESKLPFMGDIPFLGYMFRHTSYTNDVLELVVVVRPRLVKPIEAGRRVALPTDRGPLTRSEVRSGREEEKVSRPRPF